MPGNSNLHASRRNQQDEFYTEITMIENELRHYRDHFKDKIVYCNCDDPQDSHFWRYFAINFEFLGLKKLIATHYDYEKPTYKLELTHDVTGDGLINEADVIETPFTQNGDFRSPECIELLQEADIVVTNPPFSLFREYIAQLVEYDKKFLIIGNNNNITYNDVISLFMDGKVWLGYNSGHFWFRVPPYYEPKRTDYREDSNGQKWRRMGNICWYTNLEYPERHEDIILYKSYTPEEYPKYENADAIEVNGWRNIPYDYDGVMGVNVDFLGKWNPDQFEVLGLDKQLTDDHGRGLIDGKRKYARLFIKRK